MKDFKALLMAVTILATLAAPVRAEELSAPAPASDPALSPATSSVGSTDILITTLAVLLVWAAVQQNERAK